MSTVILIRGNSGSGKTAVANDLHNYLGEGNLLISQDYIRRKMLKVRDRPNNLAIGLIESMIHFGLSNCDYTIIEGILSKDKYGTMLNKALEKADAVHVYYYDLSFEETIKRHRTKKVIDFDERLMESWFTPHDDLKIRNEKIIDKKVTREEMLKLILKDLKGDRV